MLNVVHTSNQINLYKGKYLVMGKKDNKQKIFKKLLSHPIAVSVCSAAILSIASLVFNNILSTRIIDVRLSNLETNMQNNFNSLQKSIDTVSNDLSTFKENTNNSITSITHSIGTLEGKISIIESLSSQECKQIASTGELSNSIKAIYRNDTSICAEGSNKISGNFKKYVATDENSGEQYTLPDLENEIITMFYEENGEEVFFKGQFDEKGYWTDNCVINRYKDGMLVMIMDAIYDSGNLVSYQQAFPYKNLSGNDVWIFSNREVDVNSKEDARSGETYMYFRNMEYEKSFDNNNISSTDIVNAKEFRKLIDLDIEGYYNGYTSNGKFNDTTQNAYIVKYNENGNVRYLYVGKIQNGVPHDNTGNAWSISWGYADDGYYYYKGTFSNGDHGKAPKDWSPMTPEEISSIINPDNFNCPLTGLVDNQ